MVSTIQVKKELTGLLGVTKFQKASDVWEWFISKESGSCTKRNQKLNVICLLFNSCWKLKTERCLNYILTGDENWIKYWKYTLHAPTEITIKCNSYVQSHVAKVLKAYLEMMKEKVLTDLPYSSGGTPSDYNLFPSMAEGLAD